MGGNGSRNGLWGMGRYRAPAPVYPDFGGRAGANYAISTLREALAAGACLQASATKPAAAAKATRLGPGDIELGLAKLKYVGRKGIRRAFRWSVGIRVFAAPDHLASRGRCKSRGALCPP